MTLNCECLHTVCECVVSVLIHHFAGLVQRDHDFISARRKVHMQLICKQS